MFWRFNLILKLLFLEGKNSSYELFSKYNGIKNIWNLFFIIKIILQALIFSFWKRLYSKLFNAEIIRPIYNINLEMFIFSHYLSINWLMMLFSDYKQQHGSVLWKHNTPKYNIYLLYIIQFNYFLIIKSKIIIEIHLFWTSKCFNTHKKKAYENNTHVLVSCFLHYTIANNLLRI